MVVSFFISIFAVEIIITIKQIKDMAQNKNICKENDTKIVGNRYTNNSTDDLRKKIESYMVRNHFC